MTFEVILIKIEYLRIHNISIRINFHQNRFINVVLGRIFLNSRKDRRKYGNMERRSFFERCRRTYVLNNSYKPDLNNDILLQNIYVLKRYTSYTLLQLVFQIFIEIFPLFYKEN